MGALMILLAGFRFVVCPLASVCAIIKHMLYYCQTNSLLDPNTVYASTSFMSIQTCQDLFLSVVLFTLVISFYTFNLKQIN